MQVPIGCPICNNPETHEHLIWGCAWVAAVWEEMIGIADTCTTCTTLKDRFKKRLEEQSGSREDMSYRWNFILVTCWTLWKARCARVFEGKTPNLSFVVESVRGLVRECIAMQTQPHRPLVIRNRTQQRGQVHSLGSQTIILG